jgi:hypothetical protein
MTPGALQARLDAWRSEGAWRLDPARFRYLESLSSRLQSQPEPVQRLLARKLEAAMDEFAQRVQSAGSLRPPPRTPRPRVQPAGPLALLVDRLRQTRGDAPEGQELTSVRRFRRAWAGSRVLDQVREASARRPAVAGPLNSHVLVLQTLELLQDLSPDYLRHFVAQVESLQWLEQAAIQYPAPRAKAGKAAASKPARRGRKR